MLTAEVILRRLLPTRWSSNLLKVASMKIKKSVISSSDKNSRMLWRPKMKMMRSLCSKRAILKVMNKKTTRQD